MSPVLISRLKEAIRKHSRTKLGEMARMVLALATLAEIKRILETEVE
jgi:phosphoenolpyruvate-protein kinase (PTS system EI component)